VWIAVAFLFLGLCIILGLYLSNEDSRAALLSNPSNLLVFPVIVVVVAGILVLSILLARWNANKLANAMLSSTSRTVRFDEDSSGDVGTTYFVIVGKKKFKFGEDMSRNFNEGGKYKFYYCKAGLYEFVMSYEKSQ
jgi:preprotein translocase subunit SecG